MSNVIGMYDKEAEKIARREMPSVDEARHILSGVEEETMRPLIRSIAERGFKDPASLTEDECLLLLADRRVHFEDPAKVAT